MTWEAWVTLGVIVATLVLLARDVFPPAMTVLAATVFLLVAVPRKRWLLLDSLVPGR